MVQAASKQLDFYLIKKREPDPWSYGIYHYRMGANRYSKIYCAYYSKEVLN